MQVPPRQREVADLRLVHGLAGGARLLDALRSGEVDDREGADVLGRHDLTATARGLSGLHGAGPTVGAKLDGALAKSRVRSCECYSRHKRARISRDMQHRSIKGVAARRMRVRACGQG